ncbi:MAG: hypothetical protein QW567_04045 [Candidatus Hadarchaeales archaeon]
MSLKTIRLLKRLREYPTFSLATVASFIDKGTAYAKVYLSRLRRQGLVHRLQRDVYTVHRDPFLVASRIIWPSYISLWAAIRYHNLTEQLPNVISVLTTARKGLRAISMGNTSIVFERISPAYFFGFSKVLHEGLEVFVAEPEKALIDAVLLKRISVSEIYSILRERLKYLSVERLSEYILRTRNRALAKRFGWMLESMGCDVEDLRRVIYRTTIPLDYAGPLSGRKDRGWGVIVNLG